MIICVDVDGTLTKEICWTKRDCLTATPNKKVIDKVNKQYQKDFIVIYTARVDELIVPTLEWLRKNGVKFHAISNNKIPANLYLDDKATFCGNKDIKKKFKNDFKYSSLVFNAPRNNSTAVSADFVWDWIEENIL